MKKWMPCAALSVLMLGGCRFNTYEIKDAEIIDKQIVKTSLLRDYFIIIEKDGKKAKIEVEDYSAFNRMMKGQHIDAWVNNQNSILEEYQVNMGGK